MPSIFEGPPKPPSAPPPPTIMPTPDDAALQAAKRRQIAVGSQSSGRLSTIMSQNQQGSSDQLG